MKRTLSVILCIVLLAATLCGCTTKSKLLGTWHATVDLAEAMEGIISQEWISEEYRVESFPVTVELTFLKDNTFTLAPDQDSLQAASDALMDALARSFSDNLKLQLDTLDPIVDLETLLGFTGINTDVLMEQFRNNFIEKGFVEQLQEACMFSGWYKISGDKLYFSVIDEFGKATPYLNFTLEEGVLTLSGDADLPLHPVLTEALGQLTFHKK